MSFFQICAFKIIFRRFPSRRIVISTYKSSEATAEQTEAESIR